MSDPTKGERGMTKVEALDILEGAVRDGDNDFDYSNHDQEVYDSRKEALSILRAALAEPPINAEISGVDFTQLGTKLVIHPDPRFGQPPAPAELKEDEVEERREMLDWFNNIFERAERMTTELSGKPLMEDYHYEMRNKIRALLSALPEPKGEGKT